MKTLIISRHAKTEPYTSSGKDYNRVLTERGHKDILLVTKYLANMPLVPEQIYHSAAMRTTQTAEGVATTYQNLGQPTGELIPLEELYAADVEELMQLVYNLPDHKETVMIVGHNPSIAALLYCLGNRNTVPTMGTGVVEIDAAEWAQWETASRTIRDFVTPKQFK